MMTFCWQTTCGTHISPLISRPAAGGTAARGTGSGLRAGAASPVLGDTSCGLQVSRLGRSDGHTVNAGSQLPPRATCTLLPAPTEMHFTTRNPGSSISSRFGNVSAQQHVWFVTAISCGWSVLRNHEDRRPRSPRFLCSPPTSSANPLGPRFYTCPRSNRVNNLWRWTRPR